MYQKLKYTFVACFLLAGVAANAQVTVQSPYSKFGIGNLKSSVLTQQRAMGSISTGVFRTTFNNINMQNPASYAGITFTTLDMGMSGTFTTLENSSTKESSFNSSLSHVALAFPVTRKSALSFGILPYSDLGYDFKNTVTIGSTANGNLKTSAYKYSGEGGLTKAYIGYGIQFGDHFRVGANAEYLFGNLSEVRATELVDEPGSINSKMQTKNSIGGVAFSYGLQYDFRLDNKTSLVIGYSGSSNSKINSKTSQVVTQYYNDVNGDEQTALDTLLFVENNKTNLRLPLVHNFGFTIERNNKWLVGADYRMGKWSDLTIADANQGLQDTYGVSVGGQFTPDITSVNNYFKRVDYRLGFSYDKTYIQISNQDIKQTAITFGLGMPLTSFARGTFYKMNLTAELGQRGKVSNGLLQEKYVNIHLGFLLNTNSWFQRFKFD